MITNEKIIEIVCDVCHVADFTKTRCRSQLYSDARHIASRVVCDRGLSLPEVGRVLNRAHPTIMHSIRRYEHLYKTDFMFRRKADEVKRLIRKFDR